MGGFSLLLKSLNIMIKQIVMDTCRKTCFYVLICWFFRCTDTKVSWKHCFLGHVTSLRGGAVCVWTEEETELFSKSNKEIEQNHWNGRNRVIFCSILILWIHKMSWSSSFLKVESCRTLWCCVTRLLNNYAKQLSKEATCIHCAHFRKNSNGNS